MIKRSNRRLFGKKRGRMSRSALVSTLLVAFGGLMFLGLDDYKETATFPVSGLKTPALAEAPKAVGGPESGNEPVETAKSQRIEENAESPAAEQGNKTEQKRANAATAGTRQTANVGYEEAALRRRAAPEDPPDPATKDMWMTVPTMGLYNDYVANSDSTAALNRGAIKLPSTGFPWQDNANPYIAAHILGYRGTGSWQQFANLPNMTYGDRIYLGDSSGRTYAYEVSEIVVVNPQDTWVTEPEAGRDMVTLQTCINPPAYDKRLVVRADRVDVSR